MGEKERSVVKQAALQLVAGGSAGTLLIYDLKLSLMIF